MPGAEGGGHPGALLPRAGAQRGPRETCLGRETCFSRRRQSLSLSRTATVPTEHAPPAALAPPPLRVPVNLALGPSCGDLRSTCHFAAGSFPSPNVLEAARVAACARRLSSRHRCPFAWTDRISLARLPTDGHWGAPPFGCCAASSGGVAVSLGTHVGSREAGGGCAEGRHRQSRDVRGSDDPASPGSFTPSLGGPGLTGATGASLTARCPPGPCA